MNNQLDNIKDKLELLRQLDTNLEIFGSEKHKYILKPTVTWCRLLQSARVVSHIPEFTFWYVKQYWESIRCEASSLPAV